MKSERYLGLITHSNFHTFQNVRRRHVRVDGPRSDQDVDFLQEFGRLELRRHVVGAPYRGDALQGRTDVTCNCYLCLFITVPNEKSQRFDVN